MQTPCSRVVVWLLIAAGLGGHDAAAQVPVDGATRTIGRRLIDAPAPGRIAASLERAVVAADAAVSMQSSPPKQRMSCARWLVLGAVVGAGAGLGLGYLALANAGGSDSAGAILKGTTVLGLVVGLFAGGIGCQ